MNGWTDKFLGVVSPHICKGCNASGALLCDRCIIDILDNGFIWCVKCGQMTKGANMCSGCCRSSSFKQVWAVGWRQKNLRRLVGDYKYNSERAAAKIVARLLDKRLPTLPIDTVIVPIPTISSHVRQRGFDHMKLVAKELSKQRGLKCMPRLLLRQTNTVQHKLGSKARIAAAEQVFAINPRAKIPNAILLLDDIWTTGATMTAAARLLKDSGARNIIGAVVAVQPKK
ncbi:hypothetical protein FWG95_00695 [Candidatus Saccharibacteria bacterium]|nr:hypothetical protein [Candidatus Saccharibacteria bacterium]